MSSLRWSVRVPAEHLCFFQAGLRNALWQERSIADLRTLSLATADEAEALRCTCPLALDSLVQRLAAGDRVWWQWVENRLAEMRGDGAASEVG
jgi:hypothetical protein